MKRVGLCLGLGLALAMPGRLAAQGVTTGAMSGIVTDQEGAPLSTAVVLAVHQPSGTQYRATVRSGGAYNIPNVRVGGPYLVTVTMIGFRPDSQADVYVNLAQNVRLDFRLVRQAVQLSPLEVVAEQDEVLNAARTGAATFIEPEQVAVLPSVKRSTRDLTRLDPRSDGNFAFGGRNWLYNNISLDGSYFSNPFGLDDPAPGGQTGAEPVPYDAVEQVQVSIAPFDVRQGGFTGANINTVTKSGTNSIRASAYTFFRNEALLGNKVRGEDVVANPDLSFLQSGVSFSGPIMRDKLFFFINGEIERRDDPGTNFAASTDGVSRFGVSRVRQSTMDSIQQRMIDAYGYDPGPYQGYIHETNNDKLIAKLDWNISEASNLSFRYNYLNAKRDLGPHPFVLSFANSGRGPNESSLPFRNAGYAINNELHSFALELNTRSSGFANRFFASYNRFRDFREPFSADFPTIDIGEQGVTYTTVGHEPFSIHNILDQDVWQLTNNFSLYKGNHVFTVGGNFELFSFFNSFNIFRHGVFFLPGFIPVGSTYSSLDEFFAATDPTNPDQKDFLGMVGGGPFKGENVSVGQLAFYVQDEFLLSSRFNVTLGVRVDFPMYFTDPVDNPFSRGLTALDENNDPEIVDQSSLPGATPMLSPRVGFNWNASGDRRTQIRGGTGVFTGRVPFVWVGNVISNPGANPNLYPGPDGDSIPTSDDAILQQSFDLNAMDPEFRWPQVWTTDLAVDQALPGGLLGTLELVYGRDMNGIFMRNADLRDAVAFLGDGRPFYNNCSFADAALCRNGSSSGGSELNPDGGAGIYVIDNQTGGHSLNLTAQLRRSFGAAVQTMLAYNFTEATNALKSTEIASVLWQNQPIQGNPNRPGVSYSEFGQRHRIVGMATFSKSWSELLRTQVGLFLEVGEGNRFAGAGGNRYSFIYSGDVNGDGQGGNDLIYVPVDENDIQLEDYALTDGTIVTAEQQWNRLDAFIEQDAYLREHRGEITRRFGALNPWYSSVDLRILQDITFQTGATRHGLQLSLDVLNLGNLISSSWGVRKVASAAATSPLRLARFAANGEPVFNFTGPAETYIDDPSELSRWRIQLGARYFLN